VVDLACAGTPLDARNRLVIIPTRAAAEHLIRTAENRFLETSNALALPELATSAEMYVRFGDRLPKPIPLLSAIEREALFGKACRQAREQGAAPPFRVRPGLIAEIVRFYDELRRNQKDVRTFERLTLGMLEPGASHDRGADRLVRQTRFLATAFRIFEEACATTGCSDEHELRRQIVAFPAARPWRHVVVAVGDRVWDGYGLWLADWDLLARVAGLEQLDVVVTDGMLAGPFHQRVHDLLPGIEEIRVDSREGDSHPLLYVRSEGAPIQSARDREEEVAEFARWVRRLLRTAEPAAPALDHIALVVRQPLPYVYVTRETLRSAGIPCQMFDTLPLAAEPFAAALDLVFSLVTSDFARASAVALLSSPHFRFGPENQPLSAFEVSELNRALSEAGYQGGADALRRLVESWRPSTSGTCETGALRAAETLATLVEELLPLTSDLPISQQVGRLLEFLRVHENTHDPDDPLRQRQLRARGAILTILTSLRDAYERLDQNPASLADGRALVRRWIEGQTFAPRTGQSGVHLVDAESARFGEFEYVQLAGLVDGEWPERPQRNIFYSSGIVRELGWPSEGDRLTAAQDAFADLLRLAGKGLVVSSFQLEGDAVVMPSTLVDQLGTRGLREVPEQPYPAVRVFEHEALALEPLDTTFLGALQTRWAHRRVEDRARGAVAPGSTSGYRAAAFSVSALERYQDCPFKFFAADVLGLKAGPADEPTVSPRERGRFVHELLQRFFCEWDSGGCRGITSDLAAEARSVFERIAGAMLERLPTADAAIERARLFGSAVSVGIVDIIIEQEVRSPGRISQRWLEYRLDGEFGLGLPDGRRVNLKGVADRIDLVDNRWLRIIDYKSGHAPAPKRALQVPIYAL
jgi:hypothetical protein